MHQRRPRRLGKIIGGELVNYILHDGSFGSCPDWYVVLRAARYFGCPPWELLARVDDGEDFWLDIASISSNAEAEAAAVLQKIQQAKTRRR